MTLAWLLSLDLLPGSALWDCGLCSWGHCPVCLAESKEPHTPPGCWLAKNQHWRTWELLIDKTWTQAASMPFHRWNQLHSGFHQQKWSLQSWGSNHSPPFGTRKDFLGLLLPHRRTMDTNIAWSQSSSAASGWTVHCNLEVGLDDLWRPLPN